MTYYRRHVFICENRREDGGACCARRPAAADAVRTLREILKSKQMHGRGKVRVNRAGCFNRCEEGPMLVVYPDAAWYRYDSGDDLREIAESHLIRGAPVERLLLRK
ncbi:MAG: (2Fe-2S) ferredoxin domain-containing protein [Gammaproteobacteria bacterium]